MDTIAKYEGVEGFIVTCELGLFVNGPRAFSCYFPWSSVMRFSSDLVILSFLNLRNVIHPFWNLVQHDKNFRRPSWFQFFFQKIGSKDF